jgi:[Skp1-protein]-hydroxyproline N-acetylglucosaminyltransferase
LFFGLIATLYITVAYVATSMVSEQNEGRSVSRFLRQIPRTSHVQRVELDPEIQQLRHKFPITVNNEMEEIPHPGIAFSGSQTAKILLPDFEFPETLSVPKFWNPDEFGPNGVRGFLGDHGRRVMTPKESQSIGSIASGKETIFVSLASYRDSECRPTLESIFLRATHPERIRVAVVDQVEPEDPKCAEPQVPCDQDPNQVLCKFRHLIDVYEVRSYLMVGPVFARHIAHRMYRNEYFSLQVDAHVRFTQNWDEDIISQWKSADNEMTVLTTYLTDITNSIDPVSHESRRKDRNMMCNLNFEGHVKSQKHLVLKSPAKSTPKVQGTPMLHPFWSAGFSFARGHFVVQVPYEQYSAMVFQGEESSLAIRAFSYGYDFYAPERSVAFHIFAIKDNIARRHRHKFWENETLYAGALEKSMARIVGITGMAGSSSAIDYYRKDEELYGLGKVRNIETYFRTYGIHPETSSVEGHLCNFVQEKLHRQFHQYLRSDGMGINYDDFKFEYQDPFASS